MAIFKAVKNSDGNYEIFQDGNRIATGTASILQNYGLSTTVLERDTAQNQSSSNNNSSSSSSSSNSGETAAEKAARLQRERENAARYAEEQRQQTAAIFTNQANSLIQNGATSAEISAFLSTVPASVIDDVNTAVPQLEQIRIQGTPGNTTTGSPFSGNNSASTNTALDNSLSQPGAKTIFHNGQQIDIDANGNIVSTTSYQGDMSNPPRNGSIISSDFAPLDATEVEQVNTPAVSTVFNQGLTDSQGGEVETGQFTEDQQSQILATPTAEEEAIFNSEEFLALNEDQQGMLRQLFDVVSVNDELQATQLLESFEAARELADPFFAQQIALTKDALERGFVSLDKELEFKEMQMTNRLNDLREDVANQQEFLTLEEQAQLRQIERNLEQDLDKTRNQLAAKGFTFSSRRAEAEGLLNTQAGELREGTERQFGLKQTNLANDLSRGNRDTQAELARLQELGSEGRFDLAREAEAKLGSQIAGGLSNVPVLGGIQGSINQAKSKDILQGASNIFDRKQGQPSFVF